MKWRWTLGVTLAAGLALVACGGEGGGDAANDESDSAGESNSPPAGEVGEYLFVNGTPAPGSECNVGDEGGYDVGHFLAEAELVGCDGEPVLLSDVFCGSAVGWTYYYLGST